MELIPDRRQQHRNTRFGICIGDLLWWWRRHVSRGVVEGVGEGLIEAEWVDGDSERIDGFEVNGGFMRQRMNMNMELYRGYHWKRARVEGSTNFRDLFNALSFILQPGIVLKASLSTLRQQLLRMSNEGIEKEKLVIHGDVKWFWIETG